MSFKLLSCRIVIVMVTVGLSYYCYKLKSENRVEPSEQVRRE